MEQETRNCQNCHQDFKIEPDDFTFYEKMKVPAPTFCPECRMIRRLIWRNERALYKNVCALCGKETFSMYPADGQFVVYCVECWISDKWDALFFGTSYDFSTPFFLQYDKLLRRVPRQALFHINAVECDFANGIRDSRRVFLGYSVLDSDDVYYSKNIDKSFSIFDSFDLKNSENCYENIEGDKNYNCAFLSKSRSCIDCSFLFDCVNCRNCFMSSNLRNREYYVRNKPVSKDEYATALSEFMSGSRAKSDLARREFGSLVGNSLHKYANIVNCAECTGDGLSNSRNTKVCFDAYNMENTKYSFRSLNLKDSMDTVNSGPNASLMYEFITGGAKDSTFVRFATNGAGGFNDVSYIDFCSSSSYLFGCVGLKRKKYCILNKQYTKSQYESLVPKIIKHMNNIPYVDSRGRTYRYGEFFPFEFSPFAYNETIAQEYFPMVKKQALEQGYKWKDPDAKDYIPTRTKENLPDQISDLNDLIVNEIIQCTHNQTCNEQCTKAFKIMEGELEFYRRMNLPLPHLCPNCRHYERLKRRTPLKLWHRKCMCRGVKSENNTYQNTAKHQHGEGHCLNEFETSFSPDRKEIVYCEECYNAEVV